MERDDGGLLRRYIEQNSQGAFAQLTERYLRLVYGTCLRELNDPTLAEDATQVVFMILARKAASLRSQDALPGWLFTTSRLTARQLQKQERLRRERELQAFQQETMAKDENLAWSQIAGQINDAVATLGPKDRAVILLRFFEGLSLREVGEALGISENTARMRVARSVDKLRHQVARDGVAVTAVAFTALLSAEAARALPAASAAGITQSVFDANTSAGITPSSSAHLLQQTTEGVIRQMVIRKLQAAATITALGLFGLIGGIYAFQTHAAPHGNGKGGTMKIAGAVGPAQPASVYTLLADPAVSSPGAPAMSMTVSRQGAAERWDVTIPQTGVPPSLFTILMLPDTHQALIVKPDLKGYTSLPLALVPPDPFGVPFLLSMAAPMAHPATASGGPNASPIGKMIYTYGIRDIGPEAIGGMRCEHYAVTQRSQAQNTSQDSDTSLDIGLWLAQGNGAATAAERLSPIETVTQPDGSRMTREMKGDLKMLTDISGRMPLKMTLSGGTGHTLAFKLGAHSTQPLAPSFFQIPAGYQEILTPPVAPPANSSHPVQVKRQAAP